MIRSISKLFCALALTATSTGLAHAGTLQTPTFSISYADWLTPISSQGNSFTFAYTPTPIVTGYDLWIDKEVFTFKSLPHYALTGQMGYAFAATYVGSQGTADLGGTIGSFIPHCPDHCGLYDSDQLALSGSGTFTDNGSTVQYKADSLPASGAYDQLFLAGSMYASINVGQLTLQTITVSAESVQTSPVPEMPPAAMLALGLAVLGAGVRHKRGKCRNPARSFVV